MVNRPEADVGVELCLPLHVTGELLVHGVVHDDEERVVALVVVGVEARVRVLSRAQNLTHGKQLSVLPHRIHTSDAIRSSCWLDTTRVYFMIAVYPTCTAHDQLDGAYLEEDCRLMTSWAVRTCRKTAGSKCSAKHH